MKIPTHVEQIAVEAVYSLRNKYLRPGQPVEACMYPADKDPLSFHLGSFKEGKLVSVGSFYEEKLPQLPGEKHYRLRGMATDKAYRRQGTASALMLEAFRLVSRRGGNVLWCNARTGALDFYKNLNMKQSGGEFEIPSIGPHVVMFKDLIA